MADTFVWAQTVTGTFAYDTPTNWIDTTNPAETGVLAPGTSDIAIVTGPLSGAAQTITGPGGAATLEVTGLNIFAGSFSTGLTAIDATSGPASLDLLGSLSSSQELIVGNTAAGLLTIENGSTVAASSNGSNFELAIGEIAGSSGTVAIAAGGHLLLTGAPQSANYEIAVGNAGNGTLLLAGAGATLDTGGNPLAVAESTGSSGVIQVTGGAGITTTSTNSSITSAAAIGREGAGTLIVSDPGSSFTANGQLYVGRANGGLMLIENFAIVTAGSLGSQVSIGVGNSTLSTLTGGLGVAELTTHGTLIDSGSLVVGGDGVTGLMSIDDSLVEATGQILLGVGTTISNQYLTGTGTLQITDSGTIELTGTAHPSTGMGVGQAVGSGGVVQVTGTGALLNLGNNLLNIGNSGSGQVTVSQGGAILATSPAAGNAAVVLGNNAGAVGTLTVDGAGSSVTAAGPLTVGNAGSGVLLITNGGSLSAGNGHVGNSGSGSGSIMVSGANSSLTFSGSLMVGVTGAPGSLIEIGAGAAVSAAGGTIGASGEIAMGGGAFAVGPGLTLLAGGVLAGYGSITGAISDSGTIEVLGSLGIAGAVTGPAFVSVGSVGDVVYNSSVNAVLETDFSGLGGRIDLAAPASFAGSVGNFNPGDTIFANGAAGISYDGGAVIDLLDGSGAEFGTIALTQTYSTGLFVDTGGTITELPCFRAGTLIETVDGPVAVEALRPGMFATAWRSGRRVPTRVTWTGYRRIVVGRHPHPERVNPIRIARGAFGRQLPRRALFLSPDHAVFVDGMLIPVKHLVNGRSIAQVAVREVEYWHVELERHDVVRAEGLAVESYLDTGNRSAFAGQRVMQLHADFAPRGWDDACAELVQTGERLVAVKQRLFARQAGQPAMALRVRAGRAALVPSSMAGGEWRYRVPASARSLVLESPAWVPACCHAESLDGRRLGVRLFGITVDGRKLSLEDTAFQSGFHPVEHTAEGSCRWTNGRSRLRLDHGAQELVLQLGANEQVAPMAA